MMIELASLLLGDAADAAIRQRTRRKAFDVILALGGGRDEASRAAAELSDALRRIEVAGRNVRLSASLSARQQGTLLRFTLIWTPAPEGNAEPRTGSLQMAEHPEPGRASLQVLLRHTAATEASLERARAALLAQSREELYRSLEASNQALQLSHAEAQQASQAKAQFLANMSHEIRTPMNAIMGMNRLALATDLSIRQRNYLEKIEASARHLLGIVDDVLDVSKIEAGKLALELSELSLVHLLDDVTALAGSACAERGLQWRIEVAADVPGLVSGDPLRLRQVLVNLVGNAVKFTETGGVELRIARGESDPKRVELLFSVSDSGIGISAEQQEHLFKAFSQGDSTITRKFGGTGLGLAISRSLVEMMDGEITLESSPGIGSTFRFNAFFELPDARTAARVLRSDLHHRRVLISDPNHLARDNLRRLLEAMGLEVDEAASAESALAAATSHAYALFVIDQHIATANGIGNGLELAARIRRLNLAPNSAIFLTTDYGASEAAQDTGSGILAGVLQKPIDASLLFEGVAASLGMATNPSERRHRGALPKPEGTPFAAGARVLIVEDNRLNQEVAVELLHSMGLSSVVANDGNEALSRLVSDTSIDLVLMDIQMPVMDGIEATKAIRSRPEISHLPIIAMTANALSGDREQYLAAGMNRVVTKPIDPEDLFDALKEHLGSANATPKAKVAAKGGASHPITNGSTQQVPEPPSDLEGALRLVAGLDVDRGLRFSRGRFDLYLKLLTGFIDDQRELPQQLEEALTLGDHVRLARLAHTLRGLASGLGAAQLADAAEKLENIVHGHNGSLNTRGLRAAVSALGSAHASLCQGLATKLHL